MPKAATNFRQLLTADLGDSFASPNPVEARRRGLSLILIGQSGRIIRVNYEGGEAGVYGPQPLPAVVNHIAKASY